MNTLSTTSRVLAAAAALVVTSVLLAGPAFAQAEVDPVARADVKAQLFVARVTGQMMPAGEGTPTEPMAAPSTKTRAERKAETLEARRNGAFLPGSLGMYQAHTSQHLAVANSKKTRAERKAETLDAARKHLLMPAGEAG